MKNVQRHELAAVQPVEFTDTWSPWHHQTVLEQVDSRLHALGLEKLGEQLQVTNNGLDLFGTMSIAPRTPDGFLPAEYRAHRQLGLRNSMQKHFGLGFVAGEKIMVCSNLSFWGSYREVRIHDARLTFDALREFIGTAIASLDAEYRRHEDWFYRAVAFEITELQVKELTYDAMTRGILPPSKFNAFLGALAEERTTHRETDLSLAHWHGAVTRTLRGGSINVVTQRTRALHSYLETIIL